MTERSDKALEDVRDTLRTMHAAGRRLRGREARARGAAGTAQLYILWLLASEGVLTGGQLAAAAELTPATVTQMLDGLEADGLVERERSTVDRRVVHNRLTEKGRAIQLHRQQEWDERWNEALASMPAEDLEAGARVLRHLAEFYDSLAHEPAGQSAGAAVA
jgi:DNA-binding MarR family transcriptional regulator